MEPGVIISSSRPQPRTIRVNGLIKRFDKVTAVDGISFDVLQGELYGFLGPNGAGKTTTIAMLTGLARPDGGTIEIGGVDCSKNPKAAQHLMGIMPDESNLYPELSGYDNLCFCASLYGLRKNERRARAKELLEMFGLEEAAARKFSTFSKGMKRKLTIAAGIIHRPQILFLDEPSSGIDVASARQIRQLITELHQGGTTIFLTTHYIEEAERLCERIAFIVKGRIVQIDTLANYLQPIQDKKRLLISLASPQTDLNDSLVAAFPHFEFPVVSAKEIMVESIETISVGPLVRFVEDRGGVVVEARRLRPSLEDIFVHLTGIELEAMKKDKETKGGRL